MYVVLCVSPNNEFLMLIVPRCRLNFYTFVLMAMFLWLECLNLEIFISRLLIIIKRFDWWSWHKISKLKVTRTWAFTGNAINWKTVMHTLIINQPLEPTAAHNFSFIVNLTIPFLMGLFNLHVYVYYITRPRIPLLFQNVHSVRCGFSFYIFFIRAFHIFRCSVFF